MHKLHPYKIKLVHELNVDDPHRRMQFCGERSQRLIEDPDSLYDIFFSDESTFYLNGALNRHYCRYFDKSSPDSFCDVLIQHPEKSTFVVKYA